MIFSLLSLTSLSSSFLSSPFFYSSTASDSLFDPCCSLLPLVSVVLRRNLLLGKLGYFWNTTKRIILLLLDCLFAPTLFDVCWNLSLTQHLSGPLWSFSSPSIETFTFLCSLLLGVLSFSTRFTSGCSTSLSPFELTAHVIG